MSKERRCGAWLVLAFCVAACSDETTVKNPPDTSHDAAPLPEASKEAEPAFDARDGSQPPDVGMPSTTDATSDASTADGDAPSSNATDAMPGSDASDGEPPVVTGSFSVLALAELGGVHGPFVDAAKIWLADLATKNNLTIKYIENPDTITDTELAKYALVLQLNFPPWGWKPTAEAAFEKYITEGRGGWIGLHHASLYGPSVTPASETPWVWMYNFLGKINFKDYIATFAEATVRLEVPTHPIFKGVPANFQVVKDEWYTWDKNPRPNVHVLANVDENSYVPQSSIKMGDHPVIWSNEAYKGHNAYIFIGHDKTLFQNDAYMTLLRNAIFWAATPSK